MQARGPTIRTRREQSGYSLRAFADLIGISPSWLSRIEHNQANPSPGVLRRIALELERSQQVRDAIAQIADNEKEGSDDREPPGG